MATITISGFKSIADFNATISSTFSVVAGPNGSGKSNLFDALSFVQMVVSNGAPKAIRHHGGWEHLHCYKKRKQKARTFAFRIVKDLGGKTYDYSMTVHDMDSIPKLSESLAVDGRQTIRRERGKPPELFNPKDEPQPLPGFPEQMSALMMVPVSPIYQYIVNTRIFRFDPFGAKEPDSASADVYQLDYKGHNVATILSRLMNDKESKDRIVECIELLVPSLESIHTERQPLDGRTVLKFKERGVKTHFPAHLISDGTIYILCILAAILDKSSTYGMTLIEEPERGIHPKAIAELIGLMRDASSSDHPILASTHSESVVRSIQQNELWLANKYQGITSLKNAMENSISVDGMGLEKAWLMNMFGAGTPW